MERKFEEMAVLDVSQAAVYLNCDTQKVRDLDKSGLIRGMKLGGLKFYKKELDAFLEYAVGCNFDNPFNVVDRYTGKPVPGRSKHEKKI